MRYAFIEDHRTTWPIAIQCRVLVVDALEMAVSRELPDAGLVAHSDRGVQYASEH